MTAENVGVVIPAYNAEAFLAETLDSIVAQTVDVADCVVVDDGSTDATAEVARAFGGPVRVVTQDNQGVSAARNRGVTELTSRWIAFCDADDLWRRSKLERQLGCLGKRPESSAALTWAEHIGPDGDALGREHPEPRPDEIALCDIVQHRPGLVPAATASCLLVSREFLGRVGPWDESLSDAADWDYLIRLRKLGPLAGPAEPLVAYRVHGDAMSADVDGRIRDVRRLFKKLRHDSGILERCGRELYAAWGWQVRVMTASLWRAGRRIDALKLLARELPRAPLDVIRGLLE